MLEMVLKEFLLKLYDNFYLLWLCDAIIIVGNIVFVFSLPDIALELDTMTSLTGHYCADCGFQSGKILSTLIHLSDFNINLRHPDNLLQKIRHQNIAHLQHKRLFSNMLLNMDYVCNLP